MLRVYMSAKTQEEFDSQVLSPLSDSKVKADGKLLSAINENIQVNSGHSHITLSSPSLIARFGKKLEAAAVNNEDESAGVSRIRPFARMVAEVAEYLAIDSPEPDGIYVRGKVAARVKNGNGKNGKE